MRRLIFVILSIFFALGPIFACWQEAFAAIDCTSYPTSEDGRCLNQAYFSGIDFGASVTNGGYGSTGVFANAGTPNAGNLCPSFDNTDANIIGPLQCGLWSYVDPLLSDGLDKWAYPNTIENGKSGAAQAFINMMGDYLNYTQSGCSINSNLKQPSMSISGYDPGCQYYDARILGAAYTILIMLGSKYTTYDVGTLFSGQVNGSTGPFNNVQAGIQDAKNEFATWSTEVMQAAATGNVNWDIDSPPSISLNVHLNTSSVDWNHDEEMREENPQSRHSIIFYTPTGEIVINRRCGNVDNFSSLATVASAIPPLCGPLLENPGVADPKTPFKIIAGVDFDNSADATAALNAGDKIQVKVAGPSLAYDSGKQSPSQNNSSLAITTGNIGPSNNTGSYAITFNVYDSSGAALIASDCGEPFTIADMPYFQVNGGDVSSGSGMDLP